MLIIKKVFPALKIGTIVAFWSNDTVFFLLCILIHQDMTRGITEVINFEKSALKLRALI